MQDKRWSPKRNPFDREVGQIVYDIMHEETTQDATETAESGAAFDIANLFSKLSKKDSARINLRAEFLIMS